MSNKQILAQSAVQDVTRNASRVAVLAALLFGAALVAEGAYASTASDAKARYDKERAMCNSGQSNQDRATCLKEAGAAYGEAKSGRLETGTAANNANAMQRCDALPGDSRQACQRRMAGEGTTQGSVRDGGMTRELVVPAPVPK